MILKQLLVLEQLQTLKHVRKFDCKTVVDTFYESQITALAYSLYTEQFLPLHVTVCHGKLIPTRVLPYEQWSGSKVVELMLEIGLETSCPPTA